MESVAIASAMPLPYLRLALNNSSSGPLLTKRSFQGTYVRTMFNSINSLVLERERGSVQVLISLRFSDEHPRRKHLIMATTWCLFDIVLRVSPRNLTLEES